MNSFINAVNPDIDKNIFVKPNPKWKKTNRYFNVIMAKSTSIIYCYEFNFYV